MLGLPLSAQYKSSTMSYIWLKSTAFMQKSPALAGLFRQAEAAKALI